MTNRSLSSRLRCIDSLLVIFWSICSKKVKFSKNAISVLTLFLLEKKWNHVVHLKRKPIKDMVSIWDDGASISSIHYLIIIHLFYLWPIQSTSSKVIRSFIATARLTLYKNQQIMTDFNEGMLKIQSYDGIEPPPQTTCYGWLF
jgi:hypothetical protein